MSDVRTPAEVSEELRVPVPTLATWRYRGTGPPWFKVGRAVRYHQADVDNWIAEGGHTEAPRPRCNAD